MLKILETDAANTQFISNNYFAGAGRGGGSKRKVGVLNLLVSVFFAIFFSMRFQASSLNLSDRLIDLLLFSS